jgi:hypothetical protein
MRLAVHDSLGLFAWLQKGKILCSFSGLLGGLNIASRAFPKETQFIYVDLEFRKG